MVSSCCVVGCKNTAACNSDISLHKFPKIKKSLSREYQAIQKKRRYAWWNALNRKNVSLKALETLRICGTHFVSGN